MSGPAATVPLADVRAERAVLGALLANPNRMADIDSILSRTDFTDDRHRTIYLALAEMLSDGAEVDEVSLFSWLSAAGKLDAAGGALYIGSLRDELPDVPNLPHYAGIVADLSLRRRLERIGKDLTVASTSTMPAGDALETVTRSIAEVQGRREESNSATIGDAAREELGRMRAEVEQRHSSATWVATGLDRLDASLGGLRPGQLVIVGARTSVGKTALGLQVALHAGLVQNKRVLFLSLEMSTEEIARRAIAQTSRVSYGRLQHVNLDDPRWPETHGNWQAVERAVADLQQAGVTIVDSGTVTPSSLRSRCRLQQMRGGLDLVVVDYLQLMSSGERHDSRASEVGAISRGVKWLARDLRVPVLALCQLNREPEKRDTGAGGPVGQGKGRGEPRLSDLRESGSIENDAHAVLLLHRRVEGTWEEVSTAVAILAKNRTGATGRWPLSYDPPTCRFEEV